MAEKPGRGSRDFRIRGKEGEEEIWKSRLIFIIYRLWSSEKAAEKRLPIVTAFVAGSITDASGNRRGTDSLFLVIKNLIIFLKVKKIPKEK